jgi:hypothetical protein
MHLIPVPTVERVVDIDPRKRQRIKGRDLSVMSANFCYYSSENVCSYVLLMFLWYRIIFFKCRV